MKSAPMLVVLVALFVVACAPNDLLRRTRLVPNLYPTEWRRQTIFTCHVEHPSADPGYCDCFMGAIQRQWTWEQYQERVQAGTLETDLPTITRHCKQ